MGILGSKTKNLQKLKKAGFDVPSFYALSAEDLMQKSSGSLAAAAHRSLGASSYAVRSSALGEDTRASAHAGEFKTVLNAVPVALGKAIEAVAKDAQKKLGTLKDFSILIQEFIEPDYAGVFFTQNPGSDRGWLMEYHAGRGEDLVSGSITPVRKRGYWDAYTPPFE